MEERWRKGGGNVKERWRKGGGKVEEMLRVGGGKGVQCKAFKADHSLGPNRG